MKKRVLACLLAGALFCNSIQLVNAGDVTPESVNTAIDEAQRSETAAGVAAIPSGNAGVIINEAIASVNDQLAQNKLGDAVDVIDQANQTLAGDAQTATDAANAADAANAQAQKDKEQALANQNKAEKDLEDAKKAETSKEAQISANDAKDQATQATSAAKDAYEQALLAQSKADEAKAAYDKAVADYNAAVEETNALLAQGLIGAEEAKNRTDAAAVIANSYYEAMVAAQDEAVKASEAAKENMDAANEELRLEIEILNETIANNAKNVAQKTAITVATGAALGATKVAVEVAQATVDSYEARIDDLKEQIEELDDAIKTAEDKIEELEAKLNKSEVEEASKALEAAKEKLEKAKKIKEDADSILTWKKAQESSGDADMMKEAQKAVANGTATPEQKKFLTEYVLGHLADVKEGDSFEGIQWEEDGITFSVTVDGVKKDYVYKEVGEDGEKILQYYEVIYNTEVDSADTMSKANAEQEYKDRKPSHYKAQTEEKNYNIEAIREGWGNKIYPYVYSYQINIDGKSYELLHDKQGFYYKTYKVIATPPFFEEVYHYVKVIETAGVPAKEQVSDSNTISNAWDIAEESEKAVADAQKAVDEALATFNKEESFYNAIKALIDYNTGLKSADEAQKAELEEQLDQLNKKLNGGLLDKVLRFLITGKFEMPGTEDLEELKNIDSKLFLEITMDLLRTGKISEDTAKKVEEALLGDDLFKALETLLDGTTSIDDAKAIIDIISSTSLSAQTKLVIAQAIDKIVEAQHKAALENLQAAVKKADEEVAAQNRVVAATAGNALRADAAYAQAKINEAAATIVAADAKNLRDKADQAAKDAEDAYNAYKELLEQGLAPDNAYVVEAKEAWERAQAAADAAMAAYKDAQAAADAAWLAYNDSQKIADDLAAKEAAKKSTIVAKTVKTGDANNMMIWMVLLFASLAVLVVGTKKRIK